MGRANPTNYDLGDHGYALFDFEGSRGDPVVPPTSPFYWTANGLKHPRDMIIVPVAAHSRDAYMATPGMQRPAGTVAGPVVANAGHEMFKAFCDATAYTGNDAAPVGSATPDVVLSYVHDTDKRTTKLTFATPSAQRYRPLAPLMLNTDADGKIKNSSVMAICQDIEVNTTHVAGPPAYDYNLVTTITVPLIKGDPTGWKVVQLSAIRNVMSKSLDLPSITWESVHGSGYGEIFAGVMMNKCGLTADKEIWRQSWDAVGTVPVGYDPEGALTGQWTASADELYDFLQMFPGRLTALVTEGDPNSSGTSSVGLIPTWETLSFNLMNGLIGRDYPFFGAPESLPGPASVECTYKYDNTAKRQVESQDIIDAFAYAKSVQVMSQALIPALNKVGGTVAGATGMTIGMPSANFASPGADTNQALNTLDSIDVTLRANPTSSDPRWGEWTKVHTGPDHYKIGSDGSKIVPDASFGLPLLEIWVVTTAVSA